MARAVLMAVAALLVLAATAVPAAAQLELLLSQLPDDAPACITEVAELPATQSDECTLALVYILGEAQALQPQDEGEGDEDSVEPEAYDYTKIRQNLLCDCAVLYNADEVAQVQNCLETVFEFYEGDIVASTNATEEQVAGAGSFISDFDLTLLQDECNAPCQPKMKKQKNCVDSFCPTKNLTAVYFQEWGSCKKQCKCLPRPPVPCPEESTQEACEEQCKNSFGRTKADRYIFGELEQADGNVCPNVCQCNTCPGKFQGKGKNCKNYCKKQGDGPNGNGYKSIYIQGKKAFESGPFECNKVCTCEPCPAAISKAECSAICEGKDMQFKKLKKKKGCAAQKCVCKKK